MLKPIIRDKLTTGFYKHKARMPLSSNADKKVIAIQINLGVEVTNRSPQDDAAELLDCLSVIDSTVLAELKKLLPEN